MEYGESAYSETEYSGSPEGMKVGAKKAIFIIEPTRKCDDITIEATRRARLKIEPGR